MRTYPEHIKELENKHNITFTNSDRVFENLQKNIILRHDLAYLFLKTRIFNALEEDKVFVNEIDYDSVLDKKLNTAERLKVYYSIKNRLPLLIRQKKNLVPYYLLLLVVFLLTWIIYFIINASISIINPKHIIVFFFTSVLFVTGFYYFFGRYFKPETSSLNVNILTIRAFIHKLIGQNRKDIKNHFEEIFKIEIDQFKNDK